MDDEDHSMSSLRKDAKNCTDTIKVLPQVNTIPPAMEKASETYELKYFVGEHKFGEFLVYEKKSEILYFGSPFSPQFIAGYPLKGDGLKVSIVDVEVTQDSKTGDFTITGGGPGFRHVEFTLRASKTRVWTYHIKVYGTLW
ncbi:uncharacterized protein LOC115623141 [Scaptodrosophila lebanonensis]|uniref:Uncharacterized protein LOC115623141 n=1 Tax=Drosophila lebanonensis TaxID=7225 RepID=A0A6J2T8H9_DROLE|nr:uncharacterized protein LOC115623141 [Scaptodrosophila lebanonensis]